VLRYGIPGEPTRDEAQNERPVRGSERLARWLSEWRPDVFHTHSFVTGLGVFELDAARAAGAHTIATHHLPSLGYVCRRGTLMRWGAEPCDGICEPHKCAACVLQARGLPRGVATAIAALPATLSRSLAFPGAIGTALSLAGSIAADQRRQKRLVDVVDRMVVLNETAKRMLIANGVPASRIVVNRLGIANETIARKPKTPAEAPVRFVLVGRLHRTKGIVELARAVRRVPANVPFSLSIYGPAPDPSEREIVDGVKRLLAGDPRVSFGGPLSHADVSTTLAAADVLLCPSTWFENGPTVALEAMALGTPVIGTRLGNLAEIVDDGVTGLLVNAADDTDLARAIADVAGNPAMVDRWRAALPAPRTMDHIAADYLELYAQVLHGRAVA
jgi:glycosyltransferase involved in cell wall biosynthesis